MGTREWNTYTGPTLECWWCTTDTTEEVVETNGVWIVWDCGYCGQFNEVEEAVVYE